MLHRIYHIFLSPFFATKNNGSRSTLSLAGVAQLVGHCPAKWKFVCSIPSQGTWPGHMPGLQFFHGWGGGRRGRRWSLVSNVSKTSIDCLPIRSSPVMLGSSTSLWLRVLETPVLQDRVPQMGYKIISMFLVLIDVKSFFSRKGCITTFLTEVCFFFLILV